MTESPKEPSQTNINAEVNVGEQKGGKIAGVGIEEYHTDVTNIFSSTGLWVLGAIAVIAIVSLAWVAISLSNRGNELAPTLRSETASLALAITDSPTPPEATATTRPSEPTVTYTTQVTPKPMTYIVKTGDTCASIADSFGVSMESIVLVNDLPALCGTLLVDQVLQIPQPSLGEPTPTELVDECISREIWTPYMGEAHTLDNRGCWDLQDWGILPANGGVSIRAIGPAAGVMHGIYRDMNPYSRIDFDINISSMGTIDDLEPKLMFGILPPTLRSQDTGKYIAYQRESVTQDFLYVKLNDGTLNRGHYFPIRYITNDNQHVTLIVLGNELTIYIDGNQIEDPVHLPFEVKYFWIGYELPSGTSLDAEVSNLTVADQ